MRLLVVIPGQYYEALSSLALHPSVRPSVCLSRASDFSKQENPRNF